MSKLQKKVQELAETHQKILIVESLINEARRKIYKKHGKALKALKERKRTLESNLFKIWEEKMENIFLEIDDDNYNFECSIRLFNILKNRYYFLGEICQLSEKDLLKIDGFGKKSLIELKEQLAQYGLSLNMKLSLSENKKLKRLRREAKNKKYKKIAARLFAK